MEIGISSFEFKCMYWDDMIQAVLDGDVYCAVSGIAIASERMALGMKFSLPTYVTSMKMLTYTTEKEDYWSFAEGFEGLLWLYIFLTTILAGIILWFFEENDWCGRRFKEHAKNLEEMVNSFHKNY